jgi:hypothetical protein
MKIKLLLLFVFSISLNAFGQWENLNTGINDHLNGVVFFQQNGIVSTENGLYYSDNGGLGSSGWTEIHIPGNPVSATFEDTRFTHCYGMKSNATAIGFVYACGQTITDSKAVLFKIAIPALTCELIYEGAPNTKLNKIDCQDASSNLFAVGNGGKVIRFTNTTLTEMTPITTDDLVSVSYLNAVEVTFGSAGKIWKAAFSGNTFSSVTSVLNSAIIAEDIFVNGSSTYIAGGNKAGIMVFNTTNAPTYYSNYNAPLDSNCIISKSGVFVGTDHGIYKYGGTSTIQNNYLEWQPSSATNKYNEFWAQTNGTYIYAAGDNGVLVRTNSSGGATKPYVNLNLPDFCLNVPKLIYAYTSSGTSAKWYINNVLVNSSLNFSQTFTTLGQFLITVEVTNSFNEVTTVSQTITVVPMPTINKPVMLSDALLCKQESIQIQIGNSELNVKYYLRKVGETNSNYGQSEVGNGGTITFNTDMITLTGDYYIEAINALGNCAMRFTDNIPIVVEETKADFHFDTINATVNETVNYYNTSQEAQNYQWQFTSSAGVQSASSVNPQFTYPDVGQVSVHLDAWSVNNCHDEITKDGPNIIEAITNPPSCMLLVNNGEDLPWPGYYREDISETSPTTDGFISCGSYNNAVLDSEYGVKVSLLNQRGGYLTKYDKNGVLKWVVYTINQNTTSDENDNFFQSCVADSEGNIYITGDSTGKFYDNSGKVIDLGVMTADFSVNSHFLIKLNSKGEFLWRIQNRYNEFKNVVIDNNNNVLVQSGCGCSFGYQNIKLYFNGVLSYTAGNNITDTDSDMGLIKISPTGTVLWDTEIKNGINGGTNTIEHIAFDDANNIYFMYSSLYGLTFYSASNTTPVTTTQGGYAFVKYSSAGNCIWAMRTHTTGLTGTNPSTTYATSLVTDGAGNLYVTGRNECTPTPVGNYTHIFQNTNGTTTQTSTGTYYIAKINTNGICEWIAGTSEKAFASGGLSLIDGNEWYVLGSISSGNTNVMSTAEIQSRDNVNYSLTMNRNNYFIAVYDLNGNLNRLFLNSETSNAFVEKYAKAFFKDGDNFYYARNLQNATGYNDFGNVFPALNGYDGTIMKFKESCGILKYNRFLGLAENDVNQVVTVYPNPTSGAFTIDLKNQYQQVDVEIYDVLGKCIHQEHYVDVREIHSIIDSNSGMYFIKIKHEEKAQWFKLMKH